MTDKEETGRCFRCGSPRGKLRTIWNDERYVCRSCEHAAEEIVEEVESDIYPGEVKE